MSVLSHLVCKLDVTVKFSNGLVKTLWVQLSLRRIMDTAKQLTKSGNLNEFSMVLLNNTLSLPLGVVLIIVFNELEYLSKT